MVPVAQLAKPAGADAALEKNFVTALCVTERDSDPSTYVEQRHICEFRRPISTLEISAQFITCTSQRV